jgi:ribosome-binding factor A
MGRDEERAGHRHARLEGLIFEELRALLRDDVSDPALAGVTITRISLSIDYRHLRVHFAVRAPPGAQVDRALVEHALSRAAPYLRAQLATAIDVKRVPDLRFVFDGVATEEGGPCSA